MGWIYAKAKLKQTLKNYTYEKSYFFAVILLVSPIFTFAGPVYSGLLTVGPGLLNTILLAVSGDFSAIAKMGAGIGAGIAVVGAGIGIGNIGQSALASIARQPDEIGAIRSNMIIAAALVEGVAFFAIVVCLLILFI